MANNLIIYYLFIFIVHIKKEIYNIFFLLLMFSAPLKAISLLLLFFFGYFCGFYELSLYIEYFYSSFHDKI